MAEENNQQAATPPAPRQWTVGVRDDAMAFKPRTWQEMLDFAQLVCKTEFVPDAFRNNPGSVLAAWQTGHEVGLPPMASLKYIAVINGRTRIWGNAYWALVKSHPLCEYTEELAEHEAIEKGYGECTVKRKGDAKPVVARFTVAMAEKSGVWGGKGADKEKREKSVWFLRPGRMLQWMARNLAGNDAIPEATLGVEIAELAEDEPRDITPAPLPEALKTPKPLRVEKADGPKADGPERGQKDGESPSKGVDTKPGSGSGATQSADPGEPKTNGQAEAKPSPEDIAILAIDGYEADKWPGGEVLKPLIKDLDEKGQERVCRYFNMRKRELGIGK